MEKHSKLISRGGGAENRKEKERNYWIDLSKLVFALAILLYHYNFLCLSWSNELLFKGGYICVEFFFVFSGYYMWSSLKRDISVLAFLKKRLKTIYPMYFWALLFGVLANGDVFIGARSIKTTIENILGLVAQAALVQDWGVCRIGKSFNEVTWYISAMILASIVFYLMHRILNKHFLFFLTAVTVSAIAFFAWKFGTVHRRELLYGISLGSVRAVAGMGIGLIAHAAIFNRKLIRIQNETRPNIYTYIYLILMVLGLALAMVCKDNWIDFLAYPTAVLILYVSQCSRSSITGKQYFARFSYAVYLVHFNVLLILIKLNMASLSLLLISTAVVAILLINIEKRTTPKLFSWLQRG